MKLPTNTMEQRRSAHFEEVQARYKFLMNKEYEKRY